MPAVFCFINLAWSTLDDHCTVLAVASGINLLSFFFCAGNKDRAKAKCRGVFISLATPTFFCLRRTIPTLSTGSMTTWLDRFSLGF
ncbi:hypothetical protein QBC44DRAFT_314674 [Cladorrhinum sp. PSN332]|nr:hypothetical protein QBC44DRAFT_314674 [Cladorrhinum sp. PSN332]